MIRFSIDERRVATLCFDRDDKRNAVNEPMAAEMLRCLARAEKEAARALVLRANPGVPVWCAGHDLADLQPQDLHNENGTLRVARELRRVPFPVLALVDGSVHGGGVILLLSADIVLASRRAELAIASNKLGIPLSLEWHAYWLRVMGLHKAKELLLTAGMVTAEDACAAGLYNHVVASSELDELGERLVRRILECSAAAVADTKRQLNRLASQTALAAVDERTLAFDTTQILESTETRDRIARLLAALREP